MRNRSISNIPTFFTPATYHWHGKQPMEPLRLEVLSITSLHFHDSLELGVCMSGYGTCVVEDKSYPFKKGDVQVIFPFQNHLSCSESEETCTWYWTNIDPIRILSKWGAPGIMGLEESLYTGMGICGIIDSTRYPLICELVKRTSIPGIEDERRLAALLALLLELEGESKNLPKLALRPNRQFMRLTPAIEYVHKCLNEGRAPLVEDLAGTCSISPAPFRRAFRLAMGQSPHEYIQACQMQKARILLMLTEDSVTQVAQAVGYQDVSGFNRKFLSTFGMPPREFRTIRKAVSTYLPADNNESNA